ncbi:SigE family RNA polymerase sigma factor [Micromonospora sp. 15K316]|uniref:SigE family RNA polymerase sigma factor n=1 Tax=Micromonospora sp. 15K316 TaxID=2530376 RepID=UPI001FB619CE|nr:SigE family RNA polymerase sigma factor [Micromonospora sp. 15K316]
MASRDQSEEEFREFVAARSAALLRTAYLLAGDWATAEDLLQTALTKTYLAWRRLGGIEAVEPYARRVLVNTSTSWWRRRWHGERPTEVLPEQAGADEIQRQLDRDLLWRHLRALPNRQRAVLVLRFYEDMSEAQTAALLGISAGTVKSQTARALATLRRRLGAEAALDLAAERTAEPARPSPPPRAGDRRARLDQSGPRVTAADPMEVSAGPAGAAPAPNAARPEPAAPVADGADRSTGVARQLATAPDADPGPVVAQLSAVPASAGASAGEQE